MIFLFHWVKYRIAFPFHLEISVFRVINVYFGVISNYLVQCVLNSSTMSYTTCVLIRQVARRTPLVRNLKSNDQQFHRYQQNEQPSQTNEHKKTLAYCVGNPGPDLGHAHKYGGGKPVNDISTTPLDK